MGRYGLAGRALRSPLNPGWMAGQGLRGASHAIDDSMPMVSKLGDAGVDSVAPQLTELGGDAGAGLASLLAGGVGTVGGAIPYIGPGIAAAATAAEPAMAGIGKALGSAAAVPAAKIGGRLLGRASSDALDAPGTLLSGGSDTPGADMARKGMAMMGSMPAPGSMGGPKFSPPDMGGLPAPDISAAPHEMDLSKPATPPPGAGGPGDDSMGGIGHLSRFSRGINPAGPGAAGGAFPRPQTPLPPPSPFDQAGADEWPPSTMKFQHPRAGFPPPSLAGGPAQQPAGGSPTRPKKTPHNVPPPQMPTPPTQPVNVPPPQLGSFTPDDQQSLESGLLNPDPDADMKRNTQQNLDVMQRNRMRYGQQGRSTLR